MDLDGTIFVADRDNSKVFRISPDLTETIVISVTRPMDIALFEDQAYITSYNGSNSLIKVVDKYDGSLVEDIQISTLDGSGYSRGTQEGWSGIDISDDGRIWLCDQLYSDTKDRLLVSTPLPRKLEID